MRMVFRVEVIRRVVALVGEDGEGVHKGCTSGHGPISVGVVTGGAVVVVSFLCPQGGGIVRMSALL